MSWLRHIGDIFQNIISGVAHIFTKERVDKALDLAKPISDLIVYASPFVEMLAAVTPTVADDFILSAAEKMNTTVNDILHEPDRDVRRGKMLGLVGNAVRLKLADVVAKLPAGEKIKVGVLSLRTPADVELIAGDLLDSAVQFAYSLFIKER